MKHFTRLFRFEESGQVRTNFLVGRGRWLVHRSINLQCLTCLCSCHESHGKLSTKEMLYLKQALQIISNWKFQTFSKLIHFKRVSEVSQLSWFHLRDSSLGITHNKRMPEKQAKRNENPWRSWTSTNKGSQFDGRGL